FEGEANPSARRGRPRSAAKTHGFALEVEQLLRLDLPPLSFDDFQKASLDRREPFDLFGELLGIAQNFPCILERKGNRWRRWTTEVMARNCARGFERSLRKKRPNAAGIFAVPRSELDQKRMR